MIFYAGIFDRIFNDKPCFLRSNILQIMFQEHERNCSQDVPIETDFGTPRSTNSGASTASISESSSDDSSSGYSSATIQERISDLPINVTANLQMNNTNADLTQSKYKFMNYLGLNPTGSRKRMKNIIQPKAASYAKFVSIDFSSPLGKLIIKTCEAEIHRQIGGNAPVVVASERKGLRCRNTTTLCILDDKEEDFPVTFKKDRFQPARREPHLYCFNSFQRQMRLQVLEQGKRFSK